MLDPGGQRVGNDAVADDNRGSGLGGAATREHRQLAEDGLLVAVEEAVGPLHHFVDRAMPFDGSATVVETIHPLGHLGEDFDRGPCHPPGSRQLNGEREPIEPAAEFGYGGGVSIAEGETGPHGRRPIGEEGNGRPVAGSRRRRRQRIDGHEVLPIDAEAAAAGGEHVDSCRVRQHRTDQGVHGVGHVLAVVEDKE